MRGIATTLGFLFLFVAGGSGCGASSSAELVKVYKTHTCKCCGKWVDYLEANGFAVETIEVLSVKPAKTANGVPPELSSCHTALVGGYVVEGHVPIADIRRLLEERPDIEGIAVPGMPIGSPGMEGPHPESYDVVSFRGGARVAVFATHQGVSSMP